MRVHAYTRRESPPMPVDVNKSHLTLFHRIWRRISTYCKRMLMSGTMVEFVELNDDRGIPSVHFVTSCIVRIPVVWW